MFCLKPSDRISIDVPSADQFKKSWPIMVLKIIFLTSRQIINFRRRYVIGVNKYGGINWPFKSMRTDDVTGGIRSKTGYQPRISYQPTWHSWLEHSTRKLEVVGLIPVLVNLTIINCLSDETLNRGPVWRCYTPSMLNNLAELSVVSSCILALSPITTNRLLGGVVQMGNR